MIPQIGPAVVNLRQWVANQQLLPKFSVYTLKRMLKVAHFRWKPVRKSMKDQQDAVLMAFFQAGTRPTPSGTRAGFMTKQAWG